MVVEEKPPRMIKAPMDWYSWLRGTGLDPAVVYEYALVFSQNELEEDDVPHLDHPFLQSMGVSIAKHRLEILKLASRQKRPAFATLLRPVSRLLAATKKTKRYIAKYVGELVVRREKEREYNSSSALAVVPPARRGTGWKGAMLKRSRSMGMVGGNGRVMMITNRDRAAGGRVADGGGPLVYSHRMSYRADDYGDGKEGSEGEEEEEIIRWDSMFLDMKPT